MFNTVDSTALDMLQLSSMTRGTNVAAPSRAISSLLSGSHKHSNKIILRYAMRKDVMAAVAKSY